jgi:DNA sulfur modification protein DndD
MLLKLVTEHPKGCNCPICDTIIDDKNISRIKEALKTKSVFIDSDLQKRNSQLITEIGILKGLKWEDHTEVIKTAIKEIEKLKTKIQLKLLEKKRLDDERRKLGLDSEESTIQGLIPEHDRLTKLIETYRDGIKDAQNVIEKNKKSIGKLREKIKKEQTNTALEVAQNELDLCQDICNLFDEAIEKFKLNLKENVQRDATEYFKSVAHKSDYKQLSINEEYGLEILTSNGVKVPHRSSGYVQVVAISLIAALHKNAPISGPIVMDSTFQRIDPRHKSNILSSLPNLGRQVVVLAYPEEIQENVARNVLKGKLRKEVTLEQISSFNTIIK